MQLECNSQITVLKMYDGNLTDAMDISATDVVWSTKLVTCLPSSFSRFLCGFPSHFSNNNFDARTNIFHSEYKQTAVC